MLRPTLISALLCLSTTALGASPTIQDTQADYCPRIAAIAYTVMTGRQVGVSVSEMMENAKGYGQFAELAQAMTLDAFSWEVYPTLEQRVGAAKSYRDSVERSCWGSGQ